MQSGNTTHYYRRQNMNEIKNLEEMNELAMELHEKIYRYNNKHPDSMIYYLDDLLTLLSKSVRRERDRIEKSYTKHESK